mgnify:CR=1 FL=1
MRIKLSAQLSKNCKVAVVGLGTVGLPTAIHTSRYFDVTGFDTNLKAVRRVRRRGMQAFNRIGGHFDVYIVIVSTLLGTGGIPDPSPVQEVCGQIAEIGGQPLVLIESTVPVGTSRAIAGKFGLSRIAVCPHRYWSEDPARYGVVQTRVLGGMDETTLEHARSFYTKLKVPLHVVSSLEAAELSKIAENAYRFVQIAFAEGLKMTCDGHRLSFREVREACNSKWNVSLPEARRGIGGHCLPKDIRYLLSLRGSALLSGAIQTDIEYRKHLDRSTKT